MRRPARTNDECGDDKWIWRLAADSRARVGAFFTHPVGSTFDRVPFKLTDAAYGAALSTPSPPRRRPAPTRRRAPSSSSSRPRRGQRRDTAARSACPRATTRALALSSTPATRRGDATAGRPCVRVRHTVQKKFIYRSVERELRDQMLKLKRTGRVKNETKRSTPRGTRLSHSAFSVASSSSRRFTSEGRSIQKKFTGQSKGDAIKR